MNLAIAGLIAPLLLPFAAQAEEVTLTVGTNENAELFGIDQNSLQGHLQGATSEDLHVVDQGPFLGAMANAGSLAARGMGVDYATNPKKFVLGASFGSAVYDDGTSLSNEDEGLPEAGFGTQASVMAGINLGVFNGKDTFADRMMLYGHFLSLATPRVGEFDGHATQAGGHLQMKLVPKLGIGVAEFGGLDFTTGVEFTRYTLGLSEQLAFDTPGGDEATVTWRTDGSFTVTTTGLTIPLEASTNVRLLFLTVFGGAALDLHPLNTGSSNASLSGNLVATSDLIADETHIGEAALSITADGRGLPVTPRVFVGPQVNLWAVRAYMQLNVGLTGGFGLHAGARIAL